MRVAGELDGDPEPDNGGIIPVATGDPAFEVVGEPGPEADLVPEGRGVSPESGEPAESVKVRVSSAGMDCSRCAGM